MGKVQIKLPSWCVSINAKASSWITLERKIGKDTKPIDLLTKISMTNSNFRQSVYNPNAGIISEQIMVFLNSNLLTFQEMSQIKLTDGDILMLLPIYFGG